MGKVGRDEHQRSVRSYKGIGYPLKGDKKVRPSIRIRSGYYFSSQDSGANVSSIH